MSLSLLKRLGAAAALLVLPLPAIGCTASSGMTPDDLLNNATEDEASAASAVHRGDGTFYTRVDEGGHCSFGATGLTLFAAMNHTDYANSAACGACAEVTGPEGKVTVRITNECPECSPGDLDFSEQAFERLAPLSRGRIPISWRYVSCKDISGPIAYHFKEGSNPYWTAVQIRNHVRPISKLEAMKDGHFVTLRRDTDNYFIFDRGLGPGPFAFRVSDNAGHVVQDSGVAFRPGESVSSPGDKQFPR